MRATARSPTREQPAESRAAHALFYDDTAANFHGSGPRGKFPRIICQRLQRALTVAQLTQAHKLFEQQTTAGAAQPKPFFFFDFDGTLTLADGCAHASRLVRPSSRCGALAVLLPGGG
jgi:hypothetical protein